MDEDFGSRYRMPDMGNLKGPKFGDIDWRDDISEKELENLFKGMGKEFKATSTTTENMGDGTQHTRTTTTTQSADGTTTKTTTSTWSNMNFGGGGKVPLHERIKMAEIAAKKKLAEMEANKASSSTSKIPSFFNFGRDKGSKNNMDITSLKGGDNIKNWTGPNLKGFDNENLGKFVEEMQAFKEKEFEEKLASEPVPDGLIAKGKQKLRQNAERALFNLSHKIRGVVARGMVRKIKDKEERGEYNNFKK